MAPGNRRLLRNLLLPSPSAWAILPWTETTFIGLSRAPPREAAGSSCAAARTGRPPILRRGPLTSEPGSTNMAGATLRCPTASSILPTSMTNGSTGRQGTARRNRSPRRPTRKAVFATPIWLWIGSGAASSPSAKTTPSPARSRSMPWSVCPQSAYPQSVWREPV